MNIAIVGTGLVGRVLALNLLREGHTLTLFDKDSKDDNNTEKFFELMKDKDVIIYQDNCLEHEGFKSIKIKDKKKILEEQDIMSINDYVKYIVTNFQDKFPDTKLSEKLGISRKSLWEKRKKLGVEKKK